MSLFFFVFLLGSLIVIVFLLWTVRPTKRLFGLRGKLLRLDNLSYNLLWPVKPLCLSKDWYNKAIQTVPKEVQNNLEENHYVLLQLIARKYKYYSLAILFMKILVAVSLMTTLGIGFILVCSKLFAGL